jgi:DnaK suppressor protein
MNEDQLKKYKTLLEKERAMVSGEINREEKPVDFGNDIDHGDEGSDQSEEVGNRMAVANDLKNRLSEIDIALGKIQAGNYGACEKCDKQIEEEILNIDPESRFCKEHKAQI